MGRAPVLNADFLGQNGGEKEGAVGALPGVGSPRDSPIINTSINLMGRSFDAADQFAENCFDP